MSYTPIEGVLDASWVGSAPYAPPITIAAGDWREGLAPIYPVGFRSSKIGTQFVTKQQFVDPLGWNATGYGTALGTLSGQYIPPYAAIDVSWVGAFIYTPPAPPFVATWVVSPLANDISVFGTGFKSSVFGEPLTWQPQFVAPDGLDTARFGWATAFREGEYPPRHGVLHADWLGSPLYVPYEGWAFALWKVLPKGAVWAHGFDHSRFGSAPHVWSTHQYIQPPGTSTEGFGGAELILKAQGVFVGGIAPPSQTAPNNGNRQIPDPWISYRVRQLTGAGNINTFALPNTHNISQWIQYVDQAARGIAPVGVGTPVVMFRHREVFPTFILGPYWGRRSSAASSSSLRAGTRRSSATTPSC